MTEQLDNLRLELDGLAKRAFIVAPLAQVKLLMAKAWIGKIKAAQGSESPYKNDGKRHTVADIEPTDAEAPDVEFPHNFVEEIDQLRGEVKRLSASSEEVFATATPNGRLEAIARTNVYNYLVEAGFELGFELGRIRDNA